MRCYIFFLLSFVLLLSFDGVCLARIINHHESLHEDDVSRQRVSERQTRFIRFAQRVNDIMSLLSFQSIHEEKQLFEFHNANDDCFRIMKESHLIKSAESSDHDVHNKQKNALTYNLASASKALIEWAIKPIRTVSNDLNAKVSNIIWAAQYILNDSNKSVAETTINNDIKQKVEIQLLDEMENNPEEHFINVDINQECEVPTSIDKFFAEENHYQNVNSLNEKYDGAMSVLADDDKYDASIISPITNRTYSCNGGYTIVSITTRYSCGWNYRNISVFRYMELPQYIQQRCSILVNTDDSSFINSNNDSNLISCLCGVDYYAYVSLSNNMVKCSSRGLTLHPYLSSPFTPCAGINGANKEVSDFCITTSRKDNINLPVVWNYRWRTDDEMNATFVGSSQYMVLPFDMEIASLQTWVAISSSSSAMGSYNSLQSNMDLFNYYYSPRLPSGDIGFSLRKSNRIVGQFEFFTSPVSFTNPALIDAHFIVVPKNASSKEYQNYVVEHYFNSPQGSTTSTITLPLHEWEDDFINGGEVYVESGVRGEGMLNDYTVVRLHISFSDLPNAPKLYNHKQKLKQVYVVLIVFIAVVVVVLVAAMVGDYCLNKGEIPDDLVSRAQHNKEKKRTSNTE